MCECLEHNGSQPYNGTQRPCDQAFAEKRQTLGTHRTLHHLDKRVIHGHIYMQSHRLTSVQMLAHMYTQASKPICYFLINFKCKYNCKYCICNTSFFVLLMVDLLMPCRKICFFRVDKEKQKEKTFY